MKKTILKLVASVTFLLPGISFAQQVEWCMVLWSGDVIGCLQTLTQCQIMIKGDEKNKSCVAMVPPKK